jgi:hypothetical protein
MPQARHHFLLTTQKTTICLHLLQLRTERLSEEGESPLKHEGRDDPSIEVVVDVGKS